MERVKTAQFDLVFDKSGLNMNGVPVLLHSKDNMDFTTEVILALNKKPATTTTTEKPATSPATTAAPASSPKKP
jgi:hypothetical protein